MPSVFFAPAPPYHTSGYSTISDCSYSVRHAPCASSASEGLSADPCPKALFVCFLAARMEGGVPGVEFDPRLNALSTREDVADEEPSARTEDEESPRGR